MPAWRKAAATYNFASDHYDSTPLAFWDRHGQRTVDLMGLKAGDCVLDVGCGTGASALPAAEAVGRDGYVVGIDVAENMLTRARAKARDRGLDNVEFDLADMADCGRADQTFDAVISSFSVFFMPDLETQVAELWRLVRPGGRLGITVWGPDAFEPGATIFSQEVRRIRPDMPDLKRPWERLTEPEALRGLMRDSGTADPVVTTTEHTQALGEVEDWWTIAMGSGFRAEIEQLHPRERKIVKQHVLARLTDQKVEAVAAHAVHAVARKSRSRQIRKPIGCAVRPHSRTSSEAVTD